MINQFKIFESNEENMKVLGTNRSYWSYDDDEDDIIAKILLDTNNSLYLQIQQTHTKFGLGAGTRTAQLEFVNIGTLEKPTLGIVRTLLKNHGHLKTSASYGFSQLWQDEEGNKMSLGDLIKLYKEEHPIQKLKHITPISSFEIPKDIELVQYSDRSYALFGLGTKEIKDELINLGCRYNKFLTDPKTGQKRPGWIFSISKLDKIKQLIN